MLLTRKLLDFLNRVFDKNPRQFLALRLNYDGQMTWTVQDAVLTTSVVGGSGAALSVDLTQYTLRSLVDFLAQQPGYSVPYWDASDNVLLGARTLLDASGDPSTSNGDHLYAYTSALFSWLEAAARELKTAADQIAQALAQMNTLTAADMWLDEWGGYYGVPRMAGELDAQYAPRIIAEVLRSRGNNVAIEAAIRAYTGQQTTVSDVIEWSPTSPLFNGAYNFDGSQKYNAGSHVIYGKFDIALGYDLLSGSDPTAFSNTITALVGRLRDAGTQLRALSLTGSELADEAAGPADAMDTIVIGYEDSDSDAGPIADDMDVEVAMVDLTDSPDAPAEALELDVQWAVTFNGVRKFDGAVTYVGNGLVTETL